MCTCVFVCLLHVCLCVQIFGHEKVSVVDGGLPKWKELGFPLVMGPQGDVSASTYKATFDHSRLSTRDQVIYALDYNSGQVKRTLYLV